MVMNKVSLAALGVVIVSGAVILPKLFRQDTSVPGTPEKNEISIGTETKPADVPLPQQEDIVRNFLNLISEGKIPEAVEMLSPQAAGNDSQKQAWGVQFNAFKTLTLKKIEPAGDNNYQVTLEVEMKPEAANTPIPYYGYENGVNIRWIGLTKVDGLWKITGIATGP